MQTKKYFQHLIIFIILIVLVSDGKIVAQEYLDGVYQNSTLKEFLKKNPPQKKQRSSVVLELPFIDDFSDLSIIPNNELWADDMAYINDNYAENQPTIGVATLDALDRYGDLYPFHDTAFNMPGDTLTSHLIDLSSNELADSVYLSFFVQGGGKGNTPQQKDSLILQFRVKDGESSYWKTYWTKEGEQMSTFEPVIVPLSNASMLHDSTQFRFINFFSLEYAAMNCDHWNIDYVMMDEGRSVNDSLIDEVAYTQNINNIFGSFSAVPWSHFKIYYSQILDDVYYRFRNYSEEIMNITPYLRWTNLYTGETEDVGNIANNYDPNTSYEFSKPINGSLFSLNDSDSAKFEVQNRFYISESDYEPNNSTSRIINLYNYYAYDDGTAEGMYGVSNKFGMIAVKFNIFKADSLKAVRIYFNKTQTNEDRYFNLRVWGEGGSGPGVLLYEKTRNLPNFADSINGFVTYKFDEPIPVEGVFYIGWQKITDQRLNMGFDKNFIAYQKNYYNSNGIWELSQFDGSLMIRPVLGDIFAYTDIEEPAHELPEKVLFSIYPNPVSSEGSLRISTKERNWSVELYNSIGRLVYQGQNEKSINLSTLEHGLYILRIKDTNNHFHSFKVIKN